MIPKIKPLYLALLSGILLSIAWPLFGFAPVIFIAFVPFLLLEEQVSYYEVKRKSANFFLYSYLLFFTWNVLTTWWVYNASAGGAAMAILANSLLMALVMQLFHITKKYTNATSGYLAFIAYWISFEYIHQQWDITWPWLTLGNVFANNHQWIQWYEFTGFSGGSFWVLAVNLFVYLRIKNGVERMLNVRGWGVMLTLILVPIIISYAIYFSYEEEKNPVKITIVQPNIDPYNEKFDGMSQSEQLNKLFALVEGKIDSSTDYLVAPETALVRNIWENEIDSSFVIPEIAAKLKTFPNLNIVIGASTGMQHPEGFKTITSRRFTNAELYFDLYNTALQFDNVNPVQVYHKSKLVPGVEKMPFPALFKPLEELALDLGGTAGSLGMQDEREVFVSNYKKIKIAPVICYESVYGEYVSQYVLNGANLIFIITNDGWWGDTPGYKQHMIYGRLRAIETRRSIARSANTGISCFINQRGDITQKTAWWTDAAFSGELNANEKITFYTSYGDYIAKFLMFTSLLLIGISLFQLFRKK